MLYLYFTAKPLTFHSAKVISLGGRWSDSKGSVINANDTPSFPFVYVIISVSCGTSLSTLTVESHPSFMSIFYLLSTGPRNIRLRFIWIETLRCNYYVTSETTPVPLDIKITLSLTMHSDALEIKTITFFEQS